MASNRIDLLTPRERDCLRLVAKARSSKEIAQELGLSPYTVDEYVKSAVSKLGVRNRRDAAKIVSAEPAEATPQKLGDEPQAIAQPPHSTDAMPPVRSVKGRHIPFLRQGRRLNDLTAAQRLFWIFVIALAIIILFAQLSQGMAVIQAMFQGR